MVSKEVVGVGIHPFNSVKPPGNRSTCLVRGALCSNVRVQTESTKKPIQRQSQLPISRNWSNNWGKVGPHYMLQNIIIYLCPETYFSCFSIWGLSETLLGLQGAVGHVFKSLEIHLWRRRTPWMWFTTNELGSWVKAGTEWYLYGGLLKWGVPPNHQFFNRNFHYKPSILEYPHLWKPPVCAQKKNIFCRKHSQSMYFQCNF